jgi:hypothetical protein
MKRDVPDGNKMFEHPVSPDSLPSVGLVAVIVLAAYWPVETSGIFG